MLKEATMININLAPQSLGIELTPKSLKCALLSQHRDHFSIDELFEISIDEQNDTSDKEGALLSKIKDSTCIASAISTQETLVRPLDINLKKEKDIDAVLPFQAEPILPYLPENAVLDKIIVQQNAEGSILTLLSVRKDHLESHLESLKALHIEPEIVSSASASLVAFSTFLLPEKSAHFVLYVSKEQICCVFAKEGKLIASQSSSQNLSTLINAIGNSGTSQFSSSEYTKEALTKNPKVKEAIGVLEKEINRILFSLMKQAKELKTPDLLLTGDIMQMGDLKDLLLANVEKNLLEPKLHEKETIPLEQIHSYAIPIGNALSASEKGFEKVNFRKDEFSYPYPWRQWKHPLMLYFASCALLIFGFLLFERAYLGSKEDAIRIEYSELLKHMNMPYEAFEKSFAKSAPLAAGETVPLKNLSAEDIQKRLSFIGNELNSAPDLFPLYPNVPRVSDVLAWLTTHPQAVSKDPKADEESSLISLENFNYSLVKRPDINKKKDKYQVKVEIEFTSLNPTIAREFHDALLAPNAFVDPKLELKWSSNKGKYKAAFFLKDRTSYP